MFSVWFTNWVGSWNLEACPSQNSAMVSLFVMVCGRKFIKS